MAEVEGVYDLTTVARVQQHLGPDAGRVETEELVKLIRETGARMERFCGRKFRSRAYAHNGTTLPRLTSYGGTHLWLPQAPVTAVSSLKLTPDDAALTEGWNEDFVVHADAGIIELVGGWEFREAPRIVEITYTAGWITSPTTAQELAGWGWGSAEDVELACVQQTAWAFRGKERVKEGVASRSFEGVTTAYLTDEWLPEVKAVLESYRRTPAVWL